MEEKTKLLYKVSCPGYNSSECIVPKHDWYRYEKPHPRSSYICNDCAMLYQKENDKAIQAMKNLEKVVDDKS